MSFYIKYSEYLSSHRTICLLSNKSGCCLFVGYCHDNIYIFNFPCTWDIFVWFQGWTLIFIDASGFYQISLWFSSCMIVLCLHSRIIFELESLLFCNSGIIMNFLNCCSECIFSDIIKNQPFWYCCHLKFDQWNFSSWWVYSIK